MHAAFEDSRDALSMAKGRHVPNISQDCYHHY
jgi:hypothetical protein